MNKFTNQIEQKGWTSTTLGKVTKILSGGTPSTNNPIYWDGNISWITPRDLSGYKSVFIEKGSRDITEEGIKNSSAELLPINTVLFSSRAPIGYVVIAKAPLCTNQGFKNILCDEKSTHYKFIYYWLKYSKKYIENLCSGSTFAEASASLMKSIQIKLPSYEEQVKIANILSSLDDKIELIREQNKTLEATAQVIFKEWFVNFNFPNEEGKPYKESGGEMIDSALGSIPGKFSIDRLGKIVNLTIGRTPPRMEFEWFSNNPKDVKWLSIRDLGGAGAYVNETSEYLTNKALTKFNITIVPCNTVLISFKLTVGRVAITLDQMVTNEAIAHLRPIVGTNLSPEYLYLYFKNFNFGSVSSTSSIATAFNSESLRGLYVLIPDEICLKKFSSLSTEIFKKIACNTIQIATLIKLRDTLLPKLISGELQLKDYSN